METRRIDVLCVDDNPDLALLTARRIDGQPDMRSVGRVHDPADLILEAGRTNPHVVVLDLALLGQDALAFLPALQRTCPNARVVVYSGYAQADVITRARAAGACGYVSKGADAETLFAAIRDVAAGDESFPSSVLG